MRTSFSLFQGTHDVKVGYEYVNAARISRVWSTSGLRANFANGVPTSVNTYLVQVTQFGHDLRRRHRRAVPVPGRRARLVHPGSMDADSQARAESRLALRDELELPAGHLPPDTQFFPGACFDKIDGAVVQGRVAAIQPGLRPHGRRPNGAQIRGEPLQPADQHQHHRAAEPCRDASTTSARGATRTTTASRRSTRSDRRPDTCSPASTRVRRRSAAPGVERVHRRDPAPAAAEHRVLGGYTHKQTRRNIGQTDTVQTWSRGARPSPSPEVNSGETVQVWRRGTANSAILFYNSEDLDTDYHGGDITLNKRMSNRWSMMGGASWGKVTAKTRGGIRSNPHILNYFDDETCSRAPTAPGRIGCRVCTSCRTGSRQAGRGSIRPAPRRDDGHRDQPDHHACRRATRRSACASSATRGSRPSPGSI